MANTVDPDMTAHYEPSHLNLQCLQIQLFLCLVLYGLSCFWYGQLPVISALSLVVLSKEVILV